MIMKRFEFLYRDEPGKYRITLMRGDRIFHIECEFVDICTFRSAYDDYQRLLWFIARYFDV